MYRESCEDPRCLSFANSLSERWRFPSTNERSSSPFFKVATSQGFGGPAPGGHGEIGTIYVRLPQTVSACELTTWIRSSIVADPSGAFVNSPTPSHPKNLLSS